MTLKKMSSKQTNFELNCELFQIRINRIKTTTTTTAKHTSALCAAAASAKFILIVEMAPKFPTTMPLHHVLRFNEK